MTPNKQHRQNIWTIDGYYGIVIIKQYGKGKTKSFAVHSKAGSGSFMRRKDAFEAAQKAASDNVSPQTSPLNVARLWNEEQYAELYPQGLPIPG